MTTNTGTTNTGSIALFGLFGGPNLGNNATLTAMLANVRRRRPDDRILCVVPPGSSVAAEHELPTVAIDPLRISPYLWRVRPQALWNLAWSSLQIATEPLRAGRARKLLHDTKHLFVPGTGIIDDFGQGPLNLPLDLWRWVAAAKRNGARVDCVSIGVESITGRVERALFQRVLRCADNVSYRDVESLRHAQELGARAGQESVMPDLAFSLPRQLLPQIEPVSWPPRVIGVGVMGYRGWNASAAQAERIYATYLEKLKHLVAALLAQGHCVRLLTGDTRADAAPIRDLLEALGRDIAANDRQRVIWEPIGSVADLLPQLAATDLVIATRFHNVLLALLLERPVISISYSTKNDALMQEAGLRDFCQPIEELDVPRLLRQVSDLTSADIAPRVARIREMNRRALQQLERQYERLLPDTGPRSLLSTAQQLAG